LHDNARPHTANKTNETLRNFKWEVLEHPPYSPDLAPSDFHLFRPLRHHLSAEHFPDDEAVEREVTALFRQQPKDFLIAEGTKKKLEAITTFNLLSFHG
jgi:transposase